MSRKASWAACGLCALTGCLSVGEYGKGHQAAKAEAVAARKHFGATAGPMVAASVLMPGHPTADKSKEWRRGYAEGMKEEFRSFPIPPHWADVEE